MLHRHIPRTTLAMLVLVVVVLVAVLAPTRARANAYWVTLQASDGEIANGVNGFQWLTYGGAWNTYDSHCDARTGIRFVEGSYCVLRWNVPGGLSAGGTGPGGGGIEHGRYRNAIPGFFLRTSRPGANPSYTTDEDSQVATHGPFTHGWGALGTYLETGLHTSSAASTSASVNTWFDVSDFTVLLTDPSNPTLQSLTVGGSRAGWNGPGCSPVTYTWADSGSQLWNVGITNVTTGVGVHGWQANPGRDVVASGVPSFAAAPCVSSATSGRQLFRTTAHDRSGNEASFDFEVYFDVTAPIVGAPTASGGAINDGHVFGSAHDRPVITVPVGDAHSGVDTVAATLDGASLPSHYDGAALSITPNEQLPLGAHDLVVRATDRVGLTSAVTRHIVVRDDAAPIIRQARPFVVGSATPVLDVVATDDRGSVRPSTWRVSVDGEPVVVGNPTTGDLQLPLGRLVDGTHVIDVTVTDPTGNVGAVRLTHDVDVASGVPQLAGAQLTGIFIYDKPTTSAPGETHRVRAVIAFHGRPVSGRAELRSGSATVAFRDVGDDGTIDLAVTVNAIYTEFALYAPDGAGLDPVHFAVDCPRCATNDARPVQPSVDGAGNGTVGPTSNSPQPVTPSQANALGLPDTAAAAAGSAACAASGTAACVGPYPRNVIYYVGTVPYWNGVPLAESGAALDKVAPAWKITAVKRRAGSTKRTHSIALRMWTNELAVMSITPTGAKRVTSVGVRRTWRTILIKWPANSALAHRVAGARSGSTLIVRLRVIATDRNGNASKPRTIAVRATV